MRHVFLSMLILAAATASFADGFTFGNDGYIVTVEPKKCNCNVGDPATHTISFQKIQKVTYSGQCAPNGWCDMSFTFVGGDYIQKVIVIESGKCLIGVRIILQGPPDPPFRQCLSSGDCPSGTYNVTTHAPYAITEDCPAVEPPGGGGS